MHSKSRIKYIVIIIGLFLSDSTIAQYRTKPFDITKSITALENTTESHLLYGCANGEIGYYDGLQFYKTGNLKGRINDIKVDNGVILYLTENGLHQFENGKSKLLSANNLSILDIDRIGNTLVTTNGIYLKSGNDFLPDREEFYEVSDITEGDIFSLGKEQYLRTDRKIYKKKKSWREFVLHPEPDFGLLNWNEDKMIIADKSSIVTFDSEGYVDSLYRMDTVALSKIFDIQNSKLLFCANDQLGIFDVRKKELNNFYSVSTDLITDAVVDDWDNIWIAAGSYLYQAINTSSEKSLKPPSIKIKNISVNGITKDVSQNISLKPGNNDIEVSYNAIQLTAPQELEYQTKLSKPIGGQYNESISGMNEWSTPSKEREVEYRNLTAGKYKFELRATIDGNYFTYTPPVSIRVQDDSIQKYWLFGLLGALGILLSALFFNSRYNRLKEKSDQERQLLLQKNKMLTLQQKALQLQMNPHFVFNALNSIQGLIAKEDNKNARKYLQQFSSMMRSVLNQSRQEKISLEDEVAYLKSYLSLEKMANNDQFDYEVYVDDSIEDGLQIPTMIIQPFIENAILHGVKGLAERRGQITVSFSQDKNKVICIVRDNGIGREAASKNKSSSHKSVALDVVKERLSSTKADKSSNPVTYQDVLNSDGNVVGTEVSVIISI